MKVIIYSPEERVVCSARINNDHLALLYYKEKVIWRDQAGALAMFWADFTRYVERAFNEKGES